MKIGVPSNQPLQPLERSGRLSQLAKTESQLELPRSSSTSSLPPLSRSDSVIQNRKSLTAPEVVEVLQDRAEQLGSGRIQANSLRPGLLDRIQNSAFGQFFQQLFSSRQAPDFAHGQLDIQGQEPQKVQDPAVKAKFSRNATIYTSDPETGPCQVSMEVKKGDKCNVRKTDNPHILYVEKYGYHQDGSLHIEASGYVYARDVTSHFKARTHKSLPKDQPIFPHQPCAEDIRQGAMGDCFFLAGISGIVRRDPGAIQRMIRDNGDGTVTVKLHDVQIVDGEKRFQEKYITFDKSILNTRFAIREHADTAAPWVALLEKAYAIHTGSYAQLHEGGHASDVYEVMLGQAALKEPLEAPQNTKVESRLPDILGVPPKGDLFTKHEELRILERFNASVAVQVQELSAKAATGKLNFDDIHRLITEPQPVNITQLILITAIRPALLQELRLPPEQASEIIKSLRPLTSKPMNEEELIQCLKGIQPPLPEEVHALVLNKLLPVVLPEEMQQTLLTHFQGLFGGERGSGEYTDFQNQLFDTMCRKHAENQIMGVGTKSEISEGEGPAGAGRAGEKVVKGIVSGHDYAITDVIEIKNDDPRYPGRPGGPPLRFVELRNPWGKLPDGLAIVPSRLLNLASVPEFDARGYRYNQSTNTIDAHGVRQGTFLVELSDFCKHFDDLYSTPAPPLHNA